MLTTIPFSGFYGSIHDSEIDNVLEQMVSDSSGVSPVSDRISSDLWMHTGDCRTEYSRAYVENFTALLNGETGLKVALTWESLSSPREYNFATDRIFAELSFSDVQKLFCKVSKEKLDTAARERFTSRSGFISHYSPDWKEWGSLKEWDHNQIATILEALVSEFFPVDWEWALIEDFSGSGNLDNWVYDAMDAEGKRLVKIADYLRSREERQYRGHK